MALAVLLTLFIGLLFYYQLAIKRQIPKIDEFFLAGRNIGKQLFVNSTWSNSLGFGNSMFVAIWAGYSWGLAGIWIQGIWALGMVLYGYIIPKIATYTGKYTLHGYLGATYGTPVRYLTASVSLLGLLVCIGFELTFFGEFFATILGSLTNSIVAVLLFAAIIATFCSIGGYKGNVALDRICNIFACLSLSLFLIALVAYNPDILSVISNTSSSDLALKFAIPNMRESELVGFSVFTLFQLIDMTNWQTVSANSLPEGEEGKKKHFQEMKKAIRKSALRFMLFPAIIGTLIGFYFHHISPDVSQSDVMVSSVKASLPANLTIKTIMLCLLIFGFLSSSLACTNSWLLASVQTLSWDIIEHKKLNRVDFQVHRLPSEIHEKIISRGKMLIYLVGAGGTALIYGIYKYWDAIFSLQFMMFGAGLAMLPAFIFGVVIKRTDKLQSKTMRLAGFYSILTGSFSALALFIYSYWTKNSDITGLIPPVVLILSLVIFSLGIGIQKLFKNVND